MTQSILRIGIVGLGGICRERHMPGLRKIEGVEIVAVANRSLESSRKAAAEFGIPDAHGDWRKLVARDDIDAVVIGTWPYLHHPVSMAALDAGKHVFCQARMAMNHEEAKEMHAKAQASGKVAALCPVPIGMSIDATLARLLRENYCGEARLARVQGFSDAYASPDTPMNWRKDERLSGQNMLTLGMYFEVLHRWFGSTESVQAASQIFVPERKDESGDTRRVIIPDQFLIQGTLAKGVPYQCVFNAAVVKGQDLIEIYGERGALRYDVAADVLYGARKGENFAPVAQEPAEVYDVANWTVEADFIAAIREDKPYHPDFEDGLKYMRAVSAAYESAATGQRIDLGN